MAELMDARVEVHDEIWEDDDGSLGRTISVFGRSVTGRWLTRDDALRGLNREDVDLIVENDGYTYLSDEGEEQLLEQVAAAFPGADIHYYGSDAYGQGELETADASPVFELEYNMGRLAD